MYVYTLAVSENKFGPLILLALAAHHIPKCTVHAAVELSV
jgi:hypothetical protein